MGEQGFNLEKNLKKLKYLQLFLDNHALYKCKDKR